MSPPSSHRAPWLAAGATLMALGTVLWLCTFGVPLLSLPIAAAALLAGGLFLAGEVLFWVGVCVAGPRALHWLARTRGGLRSRQEARAQID